MCHIYKQQFPKPRISRMTVVPSALHSVHWSPKYYTGLHSTTTVSKALRSVYRDTGQHNTTLVSTATYIGLHSTTMIFTANYTGLHSTTLVSMALQCSSQQTTLVSTATYTDLHSTTLIFRALH